MAILNGEFFASLPVKKAKKREDKSENKRKLETFPLSKEILNGKKMIKVDLVEKK